MPPNDPYAWLSQLDPQDLQALAKRWAGGFSPPASPRMNYPQGFSSEEQDQIDTRRMQEIVDEMEGYLPALRFGSLEEAYDWAKRANNDSIRLGPKKWAEAIQAKEALSGIRRRRTPNERGAMVDVDYDRGEDYFPNPGR